ncbi:cysteine-rich receptor-like protein kinase 10 [Morus notabilis]|uniref:cysteine-rich receptor-like protein kinase 10 n=1 Tax=Morus notabilis TaxID=981085 RepID=UPI000CED2C70|nr:cysteine-rich receptor-like protein kinase 10 [Morus notabilis]
MLIPSLLIISIGLINVGAITYEPTYLYHFCENKTNATSNSVYLSNRNTLFASLSAFASHEFQKNTTIAAGDLSDALYAQVFCRGDVNVTYCHDCMRFAIKDVKERCPGVIRKAMIWYDQCQLQYSDYPSFLGTVATRPGVYLLNTANVTDKNRFTRVLNNTMKEAAVEAARGGLGEKKFATRDANLNGFQTLFNLAQCTPDLSGEDCGTCLTEAIGRLPVCCDGKLGGRVPFPSCHIRYEVYPFYTVSATSVTPSAAPPVNMTLQVPPGFVGRSKGKKRVSSVIIIVASVVPVLVTALLVATGYYFRIRARKKHNAQIEQDNGEDMSLQFDFKTIETATSKFSDDNVLGEGGFGKVYKGKLQDGREIAVKRLSKSSGQGATEFKNEVVLVAKLQHRNLVRLLGFCLEGDEKILVYEYVPNKSLDYFLFDAEKKGQMKWSTRCNIIEGIVRGILYLHEDSRLRIIHRDLKASNILLDKNMNPKVSDFGMAKMFGENEPQGNTKSVVGTYGYMAPEYAMEGLYSVKSDVFSFGVLLLEILSGRKNTSFQITDSAISLVAHAWQLWNEGIALDLVDPCLRSDCHPNEVLRYIQIGLLCVQEDPLLRPIMSSIVLMLKTESQSLSQPERPAFITGRYTSHHEIIAVNSCTVNEMSVSDFLPR